MTTRFRRNLSTATRVSLKTDAFLRGCGWLQDEQGMALVHYAAMYNRPQIIAVWIIMALDINIKKVTQTTINGTSPGLLPKSIKINTLQAGHPKI